MAATWGSVGCTVGQSQLPTRTLLAGLEAMAMPPDSERLYFADSREGRWKQGPKKEWRDMPRANAMCFSVLTSPARARHHRNG